MILFTSIPRISVHDDDDDDDDDDNDDDDDDDDYYENGDGMIAPFNPRFRDTV